nr:putative capsid protein [Crucivirus sp.]
MYMLSKSDYAKLSKAGKAKHKASLLKSKVRKPRSLAPKRKKPAARKSSGIASSIGEAVGGFFGPAGARLGKTAGSMFAKLSGYGDYKVESNSISMGTDPPMFASSGRGTLVRHREFIQDIVGSTSFNIQGFGINAGLAGTFPWLSQLAVNFEQYVVRGMVFEFKTTSATSLASGTNTAMGTVIMATEYNSSATNPASGGALFSSKAQMENHEFCTSSIPSQSFIHAIECARGETPVSCLYVRPGTVPSGTDQRLYDLGTFEIATVGMQAANIVGELWCTYDIELLKPVLYDAVGLGILTDHYQLPVATVSTASPFGTTYPVAKVASSSLGSTITGTTIINLPYSSVYQSYFLVYAVKGASTVLTTAIPQPTYSTGVSAPSLFYLDALSRLSNPNGVTSTVQWYVTFVDVVGGTVSPTITWGTTATMPTSIDGADLFIQQANPGLLTRYRKLSPAKIVAAIVEADSDDDVDADYEKMIREKKRAEIVKWKAESESKEEKKPKADDDDEDEYAAFKRVRAKVLSVAEPESPHPGKSASKK